MDANERRRRGLRALLGLKSRTNARAEIRPWQFGNWLSCLSVCCLGFLVVGVVAADSGEDLTITQDQLKLMQDKIDALAASNESMRGEIDQLRTEQADEWLSEQRAEEIRGLVQDVLADSDTRTSLMGDGLMAGWKDHFFLASADGRFKLEIAGQMQVRFLYNWRDTGGSGVDSELYGFENPLTRLIFKGHVFGKDIQYHIAARFNFDSGIRFENRNFDQLVRRADQKAPPGFYLESAWIRMRLGEGLSLRIGQFKLPFNREELVSLPNQLAASPSLVNQRMSLGFSQGAELTYLAGALKLSTAFSNGTSLLEFDDQTGFAPTSTTTLDANFNISSRIEVLFNGQWEQFRQFTSPVTNEFGLMLGVAGFYQQGETNESDLPGLTVNEVPEAYGATVDLSADWGGASLFGAFLWNQGKGFNLRDGGEMRNTTLGWVIQGGVYVSPKWEVFARYEGGYVDARRASNNDRITTGGFAGSPDLSIVTVGLNNYIDGQDVRWTIDCGVSFTELSPYWADSQRNIGSPTGWLGDITGNPGTQVLLRTQFQLLF